MSAPNPSPADIYHPATFRDRGVAVAFTTPKLAGARVRDGVRGDKELLTSNPAGGKGTYVVPLNALQRHFRPTVHDIVLARQILRQGALAPSVVRDATWTVAREGHAGPAAREAAEASQRRDRRQALMAEFHLLASLVEQVEPGGERITDLQAQAAALRRRGRGVLTRLSRSFGRDGRELGEALATTAVLLAPVAPQLSVAPHIQAAPASVAEPARMVLLVRLLEQTRAAILALLTRGESGAGGELGRSIIASADIVLPCARAALVAAGTLFGDPLMLLRRWYVDRASILGVATRAEWFLDGWEQICLLWRACPDDQRRRAALFEMAQIVPVLPREAIQWSPTPLPVSALAPSVHVASQNDDWRSGGSAVLLIDRNERMRAMAL